MFIGINMALPFEGKVPEVTKQKKKFQKVFGDDVSKGVERQATDYRASPREVIGAIESGAGNQGRSEFSPSSLKDPGKSGGVEVLVEEVIQVQ